MKHPDLNLLVALDMLLTEGSVVGAAARMGLSPPAMSRTLGRIREAVGDPILVRAGKKLVPTALALELQEQVRRTADTAITLLSPGITTGFHELARQFTLCSHDMFVASYGGKLLGSVRSHAPKATLNFVAETELDRDMLRDGRTDIWIGAGTSLYPEVRVQTLFSTRFVALARTGHPIFQGGATASRFCAYDQIDVGRRCTDARKIDERLADLHLERKVALIVPNYLMGLPALLGSDLVMPVPEALLHALTPFSPMTRMFPIPLALDPFDVVQAWHPRLDGDAAHIWLRAEIFGICRIQRALRVAS